MEDTFKPIRYDTNNFDGSTSLTEQGEGRFVGYTDFLVARQSREHWKSKADRWEREAKNQETAIQSLEKHLNRAYKEMEELRADIKRLTSIIDLNTSDEGRDLRNIAERNVELIQMLAQINALSFKAISR